MSRPVFHPGVPFQLRQFDNRYRYANDDFEFNIDTIFDGGKDPTNLRVVVTPQPATRNDNRQTIFMVSLGSQQITVLSSGKTPKTFSALDGWNGPLDYMVVEVLQKRPELREELLSQRRAYRATVEDFLRRNPVIYAAFSDFSRRKNGMDRAAKARVFQNAWSVIKQQNIDEPAKIVAVKRIIDEVSEPGAGSKKAKTEAA